ncbi:MAG TPA: 3-deoxy-manno-octulosonate cytidylyltransferase [Gemmatimonadales bacterium]|nr:3-deoxy-manno-octulosonate cytidylyltransferase [Gemmatimonadales bacterium]
MRAVAVIPARMAASRFPGKPLATLLGAPMVEHVYRRAAMCRELDAVYVATCDTDIQTIVEGFGGHVIMTAASHMRASDRTAEAARMLDAEIIVMIQGDEPMILPTMIVDAMAPLLESQSVGCANLVKRITRRQEYEDPNTIKVVRNLRGDAMYFSRAPIPAVAFDDVASLPVFKQVCVIPFRRDFLLEYATLPSTPLEQQESIDMLRILEHGGRVRLVETDVDTHAVDTPDDLAIVEARMGARGYP